MKILHTADWHVGKVPKNQPRIDEQRLTEMIEDAWHLKAPVRVRKAYEQR